MDFKKLEKFLQKYIDDVIIPNVNNKYLLNNDDKDEPIIISIYKINLGEKDPNRLNYFLDIDPPMLVDKTGMINNVNLDLSRFTKMLGLEKNLHVYWNKRPLF